MVWDDKKIACVCEKGRYYARAQRRCVKIFCTGGKKFSFKEERCVTPVNNCMHPKKHHFDEKKKKCVCTFPPKCDFRSADYKYP